MCPDIGSQENPDMGHAGCVQISDHIYPDIGLDIGCFPISGNHVTDIERRISDIGTEF
jgi:hypothetical protein